MAEAAAREMLSPVERLKIMPHPWVGFVIMPLFAFANAGVPIAFGDLGNFVSASIFSAVAGVALLSGWFARGGSGAIAE